MEEEIHSEYELDDVKYHSKPPQSESESESESENTFTFLHYEPPSTENLDHAFIGCIFVFAVLIVCIPSFFL